MSSKLDVMVTHNKMLETKISQVAQQQAATASLARAFPGQTQPNPKGHANAITLRGGTKLDGPVNPRLQNPAMYQNSEAITQMPSYAKLLKEILSNKKKIEDNETVTLTAECNAIIQNNMPPKLKDPGEVRPTRMSLQLADCSIKFPVGMLENIPVRIGQFYIPTDSIIMDIKEDSNIPIILGRPFLATAEAITNVKKGKLTFEVGEENFEFILSYFLKAPVIEYSFCFRDVIDECIREMEMGRSKYTEVLKIPVTPISEEEN
ncbi:uncharacterized protein LOC127080089 [Lathyrus oleraceus]|uniref:uncharacterized protein LOC127080089 n=1 Tax=Pisum sativum TaxID=3888 RepID=UPI0021D01B42|nr:uncharacterized protein LOC127080089 [Pisum sativum]